jgi:hypothetical protein
MEQTMTLPVVGQKSPTGKTIAYVLGGLAIVGGGIATWIIFFNKDENGNTRFQNWKNKSSAKDESQQKEETQVQQQQGAPAPPVISGFPIEVNTHNSNVKNLQNALINVWGQKISGAPSDYLGKNTLAALQKIGYNVPVSSPDYNNILAHKPKAVPAPASPIGKNLYSQYNGTRVYKVDKDGKGERTLYKVAKAGEYIGKITGVDGGWYLLQNGYQTVLKQGTIIK